MHVININVKGTREVEFDIRMAGNIGESNGTSLVFEVPEEYSGYYKYLDILKENGEKTQTVVSTKYENRFSYILPRELTDSRCLYLQLVMKKESVIFKSNMFSVMFDAGICAGQHIEETYPDTLQFIMENKADREDTEKGLRRKLDSAIFYSHLELQENVNDKKVDKEEGKGLSENDFTNEHKNQISENRKDVADLSDKIDNLDNDLNNERFRIDVIDNNLNNEKLRVDALDITLNNERNRITDAESEILKKVDKEEGKGLSENDFTTLLKEKLERITEDNLIKVVEPQFDENGNENLSRFISENAAVYSVKGGSYTVGEEKINYCANITIFIIEEPHQELLIRFNAEGITVYNCTHPYNNDWIERYYDFNSFKNKADKSESLSGYGIKDAYTKEEIDIKIGDIDAMLDELHNYAQSIISGGAE